MGAVTPITERAHPDSGNLDRQSARSIVSLILREDENALRRLRSNLGAIARGAEAIARAVLDGGRLIYVGAGTSGRIGALDAAEWPPTFGIPAARVRAVLAGGRKAIDRAVEGAEDSAGDGASAMRTARADSGDVVCGITAGGLTPFVLGALRQAGTRGATRILITSNRSSPAEAEIRIPLGTGPEVLAGSTRMKAGIATHAVLQAMSTAAAVLCGRVYGNRMVGMRATNRKLRTRAKGIISEICGISLRRAGALLDRAGGEVTVAIVMESRGGSARAARQILRSEGNLRSALEGA
ncbi:MAG: N-acetylmuramic acid 6-phosphate etherase [Planctomycetota bacterium]|nr:N-acetylmuramic acid 6-phosphate etherase [Planctomycetota bacterium]